MEQLVNNIKKCTLCKDHLPCEPKPIISVHSKSKILIIGQAPGTKVQNSGIPWDDASGKELRRWLGVTNEQFYNTNLFGIMPMGFCFPGIGKSGDLPPRSECAPLWHQQVLKLLNEVKLIVLIGTYAQKYYLKEAFPTLTENVKEYEKFLPNYFPLVHPSPRNKMWQKRNPWFEEEVVSSLRKKVHEILAK
jgi:uracil-DNA glycosylase family 4